MSTAALKSYHTESLTSPLEATAARRRHLEVVSRLPDEPATLLETAGYPSVRITHELLEHHKREARRLRAAHMRQMMQGLVAWLFRGRAPRGEIG